LQSVPHKERNHYNPKKETRWEAYKPKMAGNMKSKRAAPKTRTPTSKTLTCEGGHRRERGAQAAINRGTVERVAAGRILTSGLISETGRKERRKWGRYRRRKNKRGERENPPSLQNK
jgi:hypothetical protein